MIQVASMRCDITRSPSWHPVGRRSSAIAETMLQGGLVLALLAPPQKKNSSNLGASHKWPWSGLGGGGPDPWTPRPAPPLPYSHTITAALIKQLNIHLSLIRPTYIQEISSVLSNRRELHTVTALNGVKNNILVKSAV